ncbi:MAG: hypothetical protein AB8B85_19520 [Paracoccaceae bacterium]
MSQLTPAIEDQPICADCGLCCDGTLFPFVQLAENEPPIPPMQPAPDTALRTFQQPCPHYRGTSSVYATRPQMCRTYVCDLLKGVMAEEVSTKDARDVIARMKFLRDQLATLLGGPKGSLRRAGRDLKQRAMDTPKPLEFRVHHARALTALALFEGLIAEAFDSTGSSAPMDQISQQDT